MALTSEGFTVENARKKVDLFEKDLEQMVANPAAQRLINIDVEYTPTELRDLLQHFGSYLATLDALQGKMEAECHLLQKGLKTGIAVSIASKKPKTGTISGDEAEILLASANLRSLKKMEIENEACLLLLKGWIKAYTDAYTAVSRIISIELGEVSLQTGRHS